MYYFSEYGYLTDEERQESEAQNQAVREYIERKKKEQEEAQVILSKMKANFV